MDLIVTHSNADFDALSSLVAAKKLYPGAALLLPGSQEPKVREFLSLCKDLIDIKTERECDLRNVKRLIIVDTRRASRIGTASGLLEKKGVEVIIYDHHPRAIDDIKAAHDHYAEVGATVTMLAELIREREIPINPLEATLIALGIYEETGSLTFRTTKKSDLDIVGYLLSAGANLSVVSSYLNRELTDKELAFLVKLMHSTRTYNIKGVNMAIATGEADEFIGELGSIVHKLIDVENIKVLFAFIGTGRKIQLVARSGLEAVDVNAILKRFGGGGHKSAASAVIKDMTLEEAEKKLLAMLPSFVKLEIFARDLMSSPVVTSRIGDKVIDVYKRLKRLGIKGTVVVNRGKIAGLATLGDLTKALKHKLGHSRIKGYMSGDVVTVRPGTPLYEMQKIMFSKKIGRLPVVEKGKLKGIVTRTDLAKALHSDLFKDRAISAAMVSSINIKEAIKKELPPYIYKSLIFIGRFAKSKGFRVYIVGGFVRDLFLGEKNFDVDITVEPNGIEFAELLAKRLKGSLVIHRRFGTASIFSRWPHREKEEAHPAILKIDIATARTESYEKPAALPQVKFSSIKEDLFRRDFAINAIAASLNPENFGEISDFFGGQRDIEDGIIRVLHDGSLIDDPTRIFRAVRFEQRFNFKIEKHTMKLIKNAVDLKMFEKVHPQRIRDEIVLILKERNPIKALSRMGELHEFRFIHPKITLSAGVMKTLKAVDGSRDYFSKISKRKRIIDVWLIYLMALLEPLTLKDMHEFCKAFVFRKGDAKRLISYKEKSKKLLAFLGSKRTLKPSRIFKELQPLSFEVILFIYAKAGNNKRLRARIRNFLTKYNSIRLVIKGDDLKKLGIEPGPEFKKILEKALYAKIDGRFRAEKDEEQFALKMLGKK